MIVALHVLLVLTGASGLLYEVVLGRYLALFLGSSGASHAVTLAAFLGGLSLGSLWAGRSSHRLRTASQPFLAYAALEAGVGLWMLLFSTTAPAVFEVYHLLVAGRDPTSALVVSLKLVTAAVLILPLSIQLGATLPVLAAAIERLVPTDAVRTVSRLYAINAAGAAAGAWIAGFYLIEALGLELPLLVGAFINLAVGAIVWWMSRALDVPVRTAAPTSEQGDDAPPALRFVLAAALTGFVTLLYEVVWTRLSGLLLGASVYAFAMMLFVVIAGISLGSAMATRVIARGASAARVFAVTQTLAALCAALLLVRLESLPVALYKVKTALLPDPQNYGLWTTVGGLTVMLHFLPGAAALGAAFPALLAGAHAGGASTDRSTARLLASNTLGNLLGAMLGSYWLMPALGIDGVLALGVGCSLLIAVGTLPRPWGARALVLPSLVLVASALLVTFRWPDTTMLYRGLFRSRVLSMAALESQVAELRKGTLLFREDGTDASVTVERHDTAEGERIIFRTNGKADGSVGKLGDELTQVMLGHLGFVFAPAAKDVFVVGLGTGQTAAAAIAHPGTTVTVAELNHGVLQAAGTVFADYNGHVLQNPNVKVILADAREVLRAAPPQSYDLCISEPSNPWVVGVGDLYTVEHFLRVKSRLRPGGLLVQWIHYYELGDELLREILCTVRSVFPSMTVFRLSFGDLAIVASADRIALDLERAAASWAEPSVQAELQSHVVRSLPRTFDQLLTLNLAGPESMARLCEGFTRTLSELYPRLEYLAPRDLFSQRNGGLTRRIIDARVRPGGDALLVPWLAKHPLDAERRAGIHQMLMADRQGGEEPLQLATAPSDQLPPQVRLVVSGLAEPGSLGPEDRRATCDSLQGKDGWMIAQTETVLGPTHPRLAAWARACRDLPRSR